jgi:peptidyl-tRNA hydrolase, PTH2 family
MTTKQVIILRADLNMKIGKAVAQGAHASMGALLKASSITAHTLHIPLSEASEHWLSNSFTKICLKVNSEAELLELEANALQTKLPVCLITDNGVTVFKGIPTRTALAIGPGPVDEIDALTKHLKLY